MVNNPKAPAPPLCAAALSTSPKLEGSARIKGQIILVQA